MNKLRLKIVGLAFFFMLISGALFAQNDTLSILHITDLHVIFNQKGYHPGMLENRKLKNYDQGENILRQFLKEKPKQTNSDLVVATGDLVDFFEANSTDGKLISTQVKKFSKLIADYRTPVLFTLGNHDGFSFDWQNNKLVHTQNFIGRARALWIRNLSCFENGNYYSQTFQLGQTIYRLIFLDDSFYKFRPDDKTEVPYIDKPQLYWLNDQLNESADDVEIIFMHIPFSNNLLQSGSTNELYEMLSKNSSCKLIFAGHHHRNAVQNFPTKNDCEIVQVQTGALVQNTDNWRQIRLTEKNILVSLPGKTETEISIQSK